MNTKTLPLSLNHTARSDSKRKFLSLSGVWTIMETIFSTVLILCTAIFFMWVNGRQQEFKELEGKTS